MPSFYPENIPKEMKDIPQWVLWKLEKRDEKLTKVPYQVTVKKLTPQNLRLGPHYELAFTVV